MTQITVEVRPEDVGPLKDLVQKLNSPRNIREDWLYALKKFLRKENPWESRVVLNDLCLSKGSLGALRSMRVRKIGGLLERSRYNLLSFPAFKENPHLVDEIEQKLKEHGLSLKYAQTNKKTTPRL